MLGAATIRLFGFSYLTLRWSLAAVAVVTGYLLQRVLARAGVRPMLAAAGTLTFCLSPLFLSKATTFLTDVPGVFAVLVCLYGCLRALEARSVRATLVWIGLATALNSAVGSSRQYAWLAGLVMVPSVLWLLRKRHGVVVGGAAVWLAGLVADCAMQFWFMHQPYTDREPTLLLGMSPRRTQVMCLEALGVLLECGLLLLPVLLALLPTLLRRRLPWATWLAAVLFVVGAAGLWRIHALQALEMPYLGGTFGLPMGHGAKVALTALIVLGLLALLTTALTRGGSGGAVGVGISERELMVVLLPFLLASLLALVPRAYNPGLWDRYLLAPAVTALICVLRLYQSSFRWPGVVLALALGGGAYSTALIHDDFAVARAQLAGLQELAARGVPRTAVTGGWAYDIETELQLRPYVTGDGIRLPEGEVAPPSAHYGIDNCQGFQCALMPDVVPKYALSPDAGDALPGFAPVPFRGWVTPAGAFVVTRFPR